MTFKILFGILLLSLTTISLSSCGDNEKTTEVYPIRFPNVSYEVRAEIIDFISFVDGSGDYTIHVADPRILDASINPDVKCLNITGKQKGDTKLFIEDNIAGGTVTLNIKVTDFYMGFIITGETNHHHPVLTPNTCLFLVKDKVGSFYLFDNATSSNATEGHLVLKGTHELKITDSKPYLNFNYLSDQHVRETCQFDISKSKSETISILDRYFELGWHDAPRFSRLTGNQIPYFLLLTEAGNDYETRAVLQPNLHVPEGFLK